MKRRTFLHALGGASVATLLGPSWIHRAAAMDVPDRLLVIFFGNGVMPEDYDPIGTDRDFVFGPGATPLDRHIDSTIVVRGLWNPMHELGTRDNLHYVAQATSLAGHTHLIEGGHAVGPRGETFDSFISRGLGFGSPVAAGTGVSTGPVQRGAISYLNPTAGRPTPIFPIRRPHDLWERLFGDVSADVVEDDAMEPTADREALRRQQMAAALEEAFCRQSTRLSDDQRVVAEHHLRAIRDLEQPPRAPTASCELPAAPSNLDPTVNANFPTVVEVQRRMMVDALACGIAPVSSLSIGSSTAQEIYDWLPTYQSGLEAQTHHAQSHKMTRGEAHIYGDHYRATTDWIFERIARTIDDIRAIPGLFERTVVLVTAEHGSTHQMHDMPTILLTGNSRIDTGKVLTLDNPEGTRSRFPHMCLYRSIIDLFGLDGSEWGDPAVAALGREVTELVR